jgi:hypothetical protein
MPYYGGTPMAADPTFLMDRLMKQGYSRVQAAAIVGNLQRESGLASNNMNKQEGAYGLMQWRGPRFDALQQFAQQQGKAWTDPGTQADFIAHEMRTTERGNAAPFMAARTVDEASAALKPVIRYGDKSGPERAMHARNFFGNPDPGAPKQAAAPSPPAAQAAQPVSRETPRQDLAQATMSRAPQQRGLRGGLLSLGEMAGAMVEAQKAGRPSIMDKLGALGQPALAPAPAPAPAPVDLQAPQQPVATAPPGAPEPPAFPGGAPLPRPRPMTGPGMMQGDYVDPRETVAGLGSLVDPRTGFDYG